MVPLRDFKIVEALHERGLRELASSNHCTEGT